ncbi:MAG TPA: hypothetical protein VGZ27_07370 [Vicinamibacterales bacterium]|nr:hypothetical protein [Vicinamibacterales bacterium]
MVTKLRLLVSIGIIVWATTSAARAQTVSAELDITGGYSGEQIGAAAGQGRVFGDTGAKGAIQYFAEAAWGQRWASAIRDGEYAGVDPLTSDVFGAAYPYSNKVHLVEAYAERYFHPHGGVLGARGGQFRTPFGIYDRSDYAYSGFIRAPLIRYDGYWALSNNYMERGALVTAGVPRLFAEASVGKPHDIGSSKRRDGTDESIRVQGNYGPFIVGVSHVRSEPYLPAAFAHGRQVFTGADARWTHSFGVQVRGEFLKGHPFNGASTTGWYLDGFLHHVGMGPFTAVVREETLDYTAPAPFAASTRRFTMGTRVRLPGYVTAQINYMHQHGDLPQTHDSSLDFTLTYSIRYR